MSLFIEQANLCLPTTKTTEMIEISIIFIILLTYGYFWKKYRLIEAVTDTQKGRYWPIPIFRHITRNGYAWIAHLSNKRDFMRGGCEICTTLAWSELALLSDISELNCTGQKVDNLRNHWA